MVNQSNVLLITCGMISKFILINFLKITPLMMSFLEEVKNNPEELKQ